MLKGRGMGCGQVTPTQFQSLINSINHHLQLAYAPSTTVWDNVIAVLTWHTSLIWKVSGFEKVRALPTSSVMSCCVGEKLNTRRNDRKYATSRRS